MEDKIIKKIFKEIGHKSERLNDLYICILKEDMKELKEKYLQSYKSHGETEEKTYDRAATCQASLPHT
jgi:hypothetical protein